MASLLSPYHRPAEGLGVFHESPYLLLMPRWRGMGAQHHFEGVVVCHRECQSCSMYVIWLARTTSPALASRLSLGTTVEYYVIIVNMHRNSLLLILPSRPG